MQASSLTDFLPYTVSQKSASLVIVKSEAEIRKTATDLGRAGFVHLPGISALEKPGKYFVTAGDYTPNALYGLLVQYGSGQISLHDKDTGVSSWVNPAYTGSSLVLVVTKEELQKIEDEGVSILAAVGPALQL